MRRTGSILITLLLLSALACDSAPPAPGATTAATATATSALSPASPSGAADQPLPQPTPSATEEAPPEMIAVQHVLVAWAGAKRAPKTIKRSKTDAKKRIEEVLEKVKKGEDFTELVKAYSDEPGAAERLGSTGKFKRGVMDPTFNDAAFALKLNQTSGVVETPFGFHIIKRNQ